jgi:hypothetical protein
VTIAVSIANATWSLTVISNPKALIVMSIPPLSREGFSLSANPCYKSHNRQHVSTPAST